MSTTDIWLERLITKTPNEWRASTIMMPSKTSKAIQTDALKKPITLS